MAAPRLLLDADLAAGTVTDLPTPAAHYLTRVLRLRDGDAVAVFDGQGRTYDSHLQSNGRHWQLSLRALLSEEPAYRCRLQLAQSLIKGDKLDFALQKATELGVTDIHLLQTERTELRLDSKRLASKRAHWQKVIGAACEQCGRARLPRLHDPRPLNEAIEVLVGTQCLLLQPGAAPLSAMPGVADTTVFIGPEGGFSAAEEREILTRCEATPVGLGPWILRADTAPITILSLIRQGWGWQAP
jgi:16S rRNA (uracil1498-N3)-methyltransferase